MRSKAAVFVLVWAMVLVIGAPSSYAFSNFNVQVNGSAVATSGNEATISSGTPYGCFTISGLDGSNPAKVIGNESAPDEILVQNVRITANSANCSGNVLFWATFNQPQYAQITKVTAERYAGVGALKRGGGGAVNSWFQVTGWISDLDNPGDNEIGTWQKKVATATSYTFDFTKSEDWLPVSLMHDRVMKAQFWFNFVQANDVLELPLVRVRTPGGGGDTKNDNSVANPQNDAGVSSGDDIDCNSCPWWRRVFGMCRPIPDYEAMSEKMAGK